MVQEPAIRWIVLLNKSPKGPLTTTEVKALIERGLLRANDLAFEIGPDDKPLSDWKLLWQFPEFNRRGDSTPPSWRDGAAKQQAAKAPAPVPPEQERRKQVSEQEAKRRVLENLPPDFAEINPEDLVAKPSRSVMSRLDDDITVPLVEAPSDEPSTLESLMNAPWLLGGFAVCAVSFGVFYWIGGHRPDAGATRKLNPIGQAPVSNGSEQAAAPSVPARPTFERPLGARQPSSPALGARAPIGKQPPPPPVRAPEAREQAPRDADDRDRADSRAESRYDLPGDRGEIPVPDREYADGEEEGQRRDNGDEEPRPAKRRRPAKAENDEPPPEGDQSPNGDGGGRGGDRGGDRGGEPEPEGD